MKWNMKKCIVLNKRMYTYFASRKGIEPDPQISSASGEHAIRAVDIQTTGFIVRFLKKEKCISLKYYIIRDLFLTRVGA